MKNSITHDQSTAKRHYSWALIIPVLLGIGLMVPRIASAQFGLFDDGNTIVVSRQILNGDWSLAHEAATGRFRPMYWIINAFIYALSNGRPIGFYIANTLILLATTTLLMSIVYRISGSRLQSSVTAIIFLLSGPVVESFFTLSKAEPIQILLILASITVTINLKYFQGRSNEGLQILLISLLCFLSMATKETSLVMVPIAVAWLGSVWLYRAIFRADKGVRISRNYAIGVILSGILFMLIRGAFSAGAITEVGYAQRYVIDTQRIINTARLWLDWLNRDYLFLIPLNGIPFIALLLRRSNPSIGLTVMMLVWLIGWIFIFLPWAWTVEYFLFPFSVGAAVLAGNLLQQGIELSKARGFIRLTSIFLLVSSAALFFLTIPNNITNARVQLVVDKVNSELIEFIVEKIPENSKLVINIQEPNEYYDQINLQLGHILDRGDLQIDYFKPDDAVIADAHMDTYIATPTMHGQYYLSVRLGIQAHTSKDWNLSLQSFLNEKGEFIFHSFSDFQMLRIDIMRLPCFLKEDSSYCDVPNTPFDTREFIYGWEIIKVPSSQ